MNDMALHLREAIEVNQHRSTEYQKLSGGRSLKFHRKLIYGEKISVFLAWPIDAWGNYFQRHGVPILKEEFVSMTLIRPLSPTFPFNPAPLSHFLEINIKEKIRSFNKAYKIGSFSGLADALRDELKSLESVMTFHHMYRHVIESLLRIAVLAPHHEALAKKKNLSLNPIWLSKYLVWAHIATLKFSHQLDHDLAPIQADNIPILFNDLPHITETCEFYGI
jgi:hypothetical protein